jgi:3-hydroxyacyl-CoA dehydrogenase
MWYADCIGLKTILQRIQEFQRVHGELWEPAPLLRDLAEQGRTFAQWDAEREKRFASQ